MLSAWGSAACLQGSGRKKMSPLDDTATAHLSILIDQKSIEDEVADVLGFVSYAHDQCTGYLLRSLVSC
jgi:hypothetical protein